MLSIVLSRPNLIEDFFGRSWQFLLDISFVELKPTSGIPCESEILHYLKIKAVCIEIDCDILC